MNKGKKKPTLIKYLFKCMNLPQNDYHEYLQDYFGNYKIFDFNRNTQVNLQSSREKIVYEIYRKHKFNIYFFLEVTILDDISALLKDNIFDESANPIISKLEIDHPIQQIRNRHISTLIDNVILWISILEPFIIFNFLKAVTYKKNTYYYLHKLLKWYSIVKDSIEQMDKVPVIYKSDVFKLYEIQIPVEDFEYIVSILSNPSNIENTKLFLNYAKTQSVLLGTEIRKIAKKIVEDNNKDDYICVHTLITFIDIRDLAKYIGDKIKLDKKTQILLNSFNERKDIINVEINKLRENIRKNPLKYENSLLKWDTKSDNIYNNIIYNYYNANKDTEFINYLKKLGLYKKPYLNNAKKQYSEYRKILKSAESSRKHSSKRPLDYNENNNTFKIKKYNKNETKLTHSFGNYYDIIFRNLLRKPHNSNDVLYMIQQRLLKKQMNFRGWKLYILADRYIHDFTFNSIITISGIRPMFKDESLSLASAKIEVTKLEKNSFIVYLNILDSKYKSLSGVGTLAFYFAYAIARDYVLKNLKNFQKNKPVIMFRLIDASKIHSTEKTSFYNFLGMEKENANATLLNRMWIENDYSLTGIRPIEESIDFLQKNIPGATFTTKIREYDPKKNFPDTPKYFVLDAVNKKLYNRNTNNSLNTQ